MAKVTTYSDLLKQLEKVRDRAIKNIAKNEVLADVVKENIQKEVYDSYTPTVYERSTNPNEGLKNSVVSVLVDDRNSPTIRINHDENKMNHTSIVYGTDVGHMLPYWIINGSVPNIFNDGIYIWQQPRDYIESSKEELRNGKFKAEITKELKNLGIKSV